MDDLELRPIGRRGLVSLRLTSAAFIFLAMWFAGGLALAAVAWGNAIYADQRRAVVLASVFISTMFALMCWGVSLTMKEIVALRGEVHDEPEVG